MDVFEVESSVRGHHVYMQEWTPFIGEKLECQREETNEQDPYAVAIVKRTAGRRTKVVGRVPRRISAACSLFLQRSGNIDCTITGARHHSSDLPQGGLEVPCTLRFSISASVANRFLFHYLLNVEFAVWSSLTDKEGTFVGKAAGGFFTEKYFNNAISSTTGCHVLRTT